MTRVLDAARLRHCDPAHQERGLQVRPGHCDPAHQGRGLQVPPCPCPRSSLLPAVTVPGTRYQQTRCGAIETTPPAAPPPPRSPLEPRDQARGFAHAVGPSAPRPRQPGGAEWRPSQAGFEQVARVCVLLHLPGSQSLHLTQGWGSRREPGPAGCSVRAWGTASPASTRRRGSELPLREQGPASRFHGAGSLGTGGRGRGSLHPALHARFRCPCGVRELSEVLADVARSRGVRLSEVPADVATGGKQAAHAPGCDECFEMTLKEAVEHSDLRAGPSGSAA